MLEDQNVELLAARQTLTPHTTTRAVFNVVWHTEMSLGISENEQYLRCGTVDQSPLSHFPLWPRRGHSPVEATVDPSQAASTHPSRSVWDWEVGSSSISCRAHTA